MDENQAVDVNQVTNTDQAVDVTQVNEELQYRIAGFWMRFVAYCIDLMIIGSAGSILMMLFDVIIHIELSQFAWYGMSVGALGVVGFTYFTVFTRVWSQTIGKMIMGIQVIRQDGLAMDWITALIREVPGRTISQLFGSYIGYIWIGFHSNKRGWHDVFSDTYVVYCNELEDRRWIAMRTNGRE